MVSDNGVSSFSWTKIELTPISISDTNFYLPPCGRVPPAGVGGSPAPQRAARGGSGRLAIFQGEGTVDEHVVNAFGQRPACRIG
jgi:hypothetical protein